MADMSLRGFVYRNGGFYMSENILRIQNVEKYYGSRNNLTKAIDDISFDVNKGEFVAIMGASGSGKTTLLNCISTIDKVTSGNIYVDGNNITQLKGSALNRFRRDKLGFIFQDFNLLDTLTAYENIALALSIRNDSPEVIDRAVKNVAEQLDITEILNKYPYQMSGGQKQRVAIAGILAMEPKCIVLDEPTAMLDPKGREEVLEAVTKLRTEQGISIVLITHYMQEATLADRIIVMDSGKILTQGTPKEVFSETELLLSHSLSVPQSSELIYKLKKAGFELPDGIVSDDECVDELVKLIKGV